MVVLIPVFHPFKFSYGLELFGGDFGLKKILRKMCATLQILFHYLYSHMNFGLLFDLYARNR